VDAYRHYLEGNDYEEKFYSKQARESFEKALEADSTFAMACYKLAYYRNREEAKRLNARALSHADNASELERLYIRVQEAMLSEDMDRRIELLQRIIELFPEDKDAHVELGSIYYLELEQQQLEEALGHYERVIEIDPLHKVAYNQLAYVYDEMGNFEKSIWAINKYIELAPDEPNPYDTKGELYARRGKLDEAIIAFEKALEIEPDFRSSLGNLGSMSLFSRDYARADSVFQNYSCHTEKSCRSAGRFCLGSIPAHQGKLKASLKTLDDAIAADSLAGDVTGWTAGKHSSKSFIYMEQGNMESALEEAKACVELSKRLYPDGVVNWRDVYVRALAASGRIAEAEDVAEALKKDIEEKDESLMSSYWLAAAYIERAKGNTEAALAHLQRVAGESRLPSFATRYQIADALLDLGRLGEAVAELEEALSIYDDSRFYATIWSVKAHYLLGTAYERSGWSAKAIEQYEEFLEIWKDADPGIEEIEDARERVARLKAAS
jgi:tetratricopeptide (TPR) repeat protein